jgi:predicted small metal-binding protein
VGADTCKGQFTADTREELLRKVAVHLRDVHKVMTPTQTVMTFILKNAK